MNESRLTITCRQRTITKPHRLGRMQYPSRACGAFVFLAAVFRIA